MGIVRPFAASANCFSTTQRLCVMFEDAWILLSADAAFEAGGRAPPFNA
jgi:hypothetical protein